MSSFYVRVGGLVVMFWLLLKLMSLMFVRVLFIVSSFCVFSCLCRKV